MGASRCSRMALLLLGALPMAGGCGALRLVQYPAFDEYRVIRQGEPLVVKASTKNELQTAPVQGGVVQGITLTLSVEDHVGWQELRDQLAAGRPSELGNFGRRRYFLVGSATPAALIRSEQPARYLYPRVEELRFARADGNWKRDMAAGWEPVDADSAILRSGDVSLLGVDALAFGDSIVIANEHELRPWSDWVPVDFTDVPVDLGLVPGAFLQVRQGLAAARVDSVRILGQWYGTRNPRAWRVREIVGVDSTTFGHSLRPLRFYVSGATAASVEGLLRQHEAEFLKALDTGRPSSATLFVTCWDSVAPHGPCYHAGGQDTVSAVTIDPTDPSHYHRVDYPFRVRRQNRALSFLLGTGALFVFVAVSTY
jgi:hypothetical protein